MDAEAKKAAEHLIANGTWPDDGPWEEAIARAYLAALGREGGLRKQTEWFCTACSYAIPDHKLLPGIMVVKCHRCGAHEVKPAALIEKMARERAEARAEALRTALREVLSACHDPTCVNYGCERCHIANQALVADERATRGGA